jgi:hypothetical protein
MAQLFHRSLNTVSRWSLGVGAIGIIAILIIWFEMDRSSYSNMVNAPIKQPVPFSHKHHVSGLGIDCRFCHASVEKSSFAGLPSTDTCMTCHSQIWRNSPMLEPIRVSYYTNTPIRWNRVHDLPNYVYFDHSIHISKGVGCSECHGRVDLMPLTWKNASLEMQWCLDCHRDPGKHLRPKSEIYNMDWKPSAHQEQLGKEIIQKNQIEVGRLDNCYVCHR